MNALLWLVAIIASLALTHMAFVDYIGTTWDFVGWVGVGLVLFCTVATIGSLVEDVNTWKNDN